MRAVILVLSICLASAALAQKAEVSTEEDEVPVTEDKDSVRRYYIKDFPEYFFLYPVLKQRGLNFELQKTDGSALLTFKPNNTFSLGFGAYVFEINVEVAFAVPVHERSIERFGDSDAQDLQLNVLAKRWGVDAFYQRYQGFYVVDRENAPASTEPLPQRPDIAIRNFGFTGHYVFNSQKFSFRSAYNFAERQLYSNGSFLLVTSLATFRVAGDSSIVLGNRQNDFSNAVDFERLRFTTFSIAPSYTYNLTYNNFFLNTTLSVGPAYHWMNYTLEGRNEPTRDATINTFVHSRVAIGYNGYRMFGGVAFISQGRNLKVDDSRFSTNNSTFKILIGYRFKESGILKKRVWDIVPFL